MADDKTALPKSDKHPEGLLKLGTKEQIEGAITVVTTGQYRGQHVPMTDEEKAVARKKIASAIDECQDAGCDDAWRKQEKARLEDKEGSSKAVYAGLDVSDYSCSVKSLGENRFGGYLVLWGNPQQRDLTPLRNPDGTKGEYFTPETQDLLNVFNEIGRIPAFYHHGANGQVKATLAGVYDKFEIDDVGVWAEGEFNKRNRYLTGIKKLMNDNALGQSSGTLPLGHSKDADGRITRWPIIEGSLTPTPMEPRTLAGMFKAHVSDPQQVSIAYKALNLKLPADLLADEQDEAKGVPQERQQGNHAPSAKAATKPTIPGENEMNEEQMKAIIAEASAKAVAEALKSLTPPTPPVDPAAELKRQLAEMQDQLNAFRNPPKVLPPAAPPAQPAAQPQKAVRITVGDELRWAGASASDVAFAAMFVSEAGKAMDEGSPFINTELGKTCYAMRNRWFRDDPERRIERRIAAKTLVEMPDAGYMGFVPFLTPNEAMTGAVKANELDSSQQTNAVVDWVPTIWSQQLILRARIANPLQALLTQVQMSSNPYNLPIESTDPTAFHMLEGTDAAMLSLANSANALNLSKVNSNKIQLTASKIGARLGFSTEVQEDALPFVVMQFGRQVVRVVINGIDDTCFNGDTVTTASTNINLIDGTPTTTVGARPTYLALDGIRKYGILTNTTQKLSVGGAITLSIIRQARFSLNAQYSVDLGNLAMFVDSLTYRKMLNMPEFLTYQNIGGTPSAISGYLPGGMPGQVDSSAANNMDPKPVGVIDGVPVYLSAQLPLSQPADGKISTTGSNNTASTAILLDRSRWFLGWRRGVSFDTFDQLKIFSDTIQMMASVRFALQPFDTACAFIMYNIV